MHTLIYTADDRSLANRIAADARRAGLALTDLTTTPPAAMPAKEMHNSALIAVLSPAALRDPSVERALNAAMDVGQHVVLAIAAAVELPKAINHLDALDFTKTTDADRLIARVKAIESGDAGLPLRTRTPSVKKSNRQTAAILAVLALGMFGAGIYGVGVMGLQAPRAEYDANDTAEAMTIQAYTVPELEQYARMIPQNDADAANYASTLRAIPTAYRPLVAGTATAFAQGTPIIVPTQIIVTPDPTAAS